jgi:arylsulfatase A-like enzyme
MSRLRYPRGRLAGVLVLGALTMVAIVVLFVMPHTRRPLRHLVIVSLDTLRADHLGAYGYRKPTSPVFDALATTGVLFERAVAQGPATLPSHGALLTGLYPSAYGDSPVPFGPPPGVPTLAEILKAHGFATWGFVDGGYLARSFGLGRGFDHYEDRRTGLSNILVRLDRWLDIHGDAPRIFLFVHCYNIHTPYNPPSDARRLLGAGPWRGKFSVGAADLDVIERMRPKPTASDIAPIVGLYDAGIRATDDLLTRLLAILARHHLREDTAIVILSDHGEEFLEHGRTQHKQLYFAPNLHVPLLFLLPGQKPLRIGTTVELIDVMPTALELLGLPPYPGAMGRSLVGLMRGSTDEEGSAYSEGTVWNATLRTLITDRFQLFYDVAKGDAHLYDVAQDPDAHRDLAPTHPETTTKLLRKLRRRMDEAAIRRTHVTVAPSIDPRVREDLRALGYVE